MDNIRKKPLIVTLVVFAAFFVFVAAKLPGAEYGGRVFTTTLSGANEAPGPGDEDGSGTATITLNPGQEEVCWHIMVSDITLPATAAHIHEGAAGVPGPVDVTLSPPDGTGMSSGCTTADRDEILEIIQHPEEYYVNVHNADYPAGAVRGQLGK